jgi:2-oxoglutarate dehydrogenase E2 component (dihydrolipoamide succinyltransferase)
MSQNVTLPALGESVTEGTVTRWLKKVGDTVAIDEPLVEVSTDKVDTEIPSPVAGVIEQILVQEDETVEVGAVLVVIGDGSAAVAPAAAAAAPVVEIAPVAAQPAAVQPETLQPVAAEQAAPMANAPVATAAVAEAASAAPTMVSTPAPISYVPSTPIAPAFPSGSANPASAPQPVAAPALPAVAAAAVVTNTTAAAAPISDAGYVTPLVRRLASDSGIDLSTVSGTGVGGRIRKDDVIAAVTSSMPTVSSGHTVTSADSPLRGTTESMSRLRKVLAERAVASMQQSAQLTTVVEVDVTKIAQLRQKVQSDFVAKTGGKLNFMPFFVLAAAESLRVHAKLNASIDGENIIYHASENISFAVDTDRGLLTPVIRDASTLSIAQIANQIADMAARTRENKLKPDELGGGTFTVTNTGSRGALFDTPVVFLPQVAILGTGLVTKRPVVVAAADGTEAIAIRSMVYLALSYDHRLVDGADASRFLVDIKTRLEVSDFEPVLGL